MANKRKTRGTTATVESDRGQSEWFEHLDELRRRIISVLAVFFLAVCVMFAFSERMASFLMSPVADIGVKLYTFSPAEKFMAYLHMSAVAGAAVTTPFFVLQTGLFIWPGLRNRERVFARLVLFAVPALFIAGAVFAYKFFAPAVLRFFLLFGSGDGVDALWSFREYLSLLSGLMFAAGASLQMPLLLLALFALGVADPAKVAAARPYMIVLIFLAAAVLTPPDITSQIMLGVPLYILFELTILFGSFLKRKK